jgi:hypothetical protein
MARPYISAPIPPGGELKASDAKDGGARSDEGPRRRRENGAAGRDPPAEALGAVDVHALSRRAR